MIRLRTFALRIIQHPQNLWVLYYTDYKHRETFPDADGLLLWLLNASHGLYHGVARMRGHHYLHPSCDNKKRAQSFGVIDGSLSRSKRFVQTMKDDLLQFWWVVPLRVLGWICFASLRQAILGAQESYC